MKRYSWLFSIVLLMAATMMAPVMADAQVAANLTAKKVVTGPGGQQSYQPAEKASPGDVIEYQATYTNQSKGPIKNLVPTMPIPSGMEYIPGSAKPAQVLASLDGKKFEPVPLKRMVTLPNGKQELRDVPYNEYRALRWNGSDITTSGNITVSARTKMTDVTAARVNGVQTSSASGNASSEAARKGGKS
jgi:uncharacterized repeat protein (TIGR01451 family)